MSDALQRLIDAVEADRKVIIPTPHRQLKTRHPDTTARIMGYVENYVVMRHLGAAPFAMTKRDVLIHLRALQLQKTPAAPLEATPQPRNDPAGHVGPSDTINAPHGAENGRGE